MEYNKVQIYLVIQCVIGLINSNLLEQQVKSEWNKPVCSSVSKYDIQQQVKDTEPDQPALCTNPDYHVVHKHPEATAPGVNPYY